jgi:lipid-binding SYLF domain-containing protein
MTQTRRPLLTLLLVLLLATAGASPAFALDKQKLAREGSAALKSLTDNNSGARALAGKARAILVFPTIVKAGFMIGGQMGKGVLLKNGKATGYYQSLAGSYGLQAGAQTFGYALFFMNEAALKYLDASDGWEVGVGPSIVVVDEGMGKSITSTTVSHDVYAFIFDQEGLMAGIGIQGSKITRLDD